MNLDRQHCYGLFESGLIEPPKLNQGHPEAGAAQQHGCYRFVIGPSLVFAPSQLMVAIATGAKLHGDDLTYTAWVDVVAEGLALDFLKDEALRHALRNGVVVTQGGACSHPPGPLLPLSLRRHMAELAPQRQIWHPLARQPVPARPPVD